MIEHLPHYRFVDRLGMPFNERGALGVARRRVAGGGTSVLPYDTVVLAESSLVHYYKLNEAAGATSISDSKGAINSTSVTNATFGAAAIFGSASTVSFSGTGQIQFNTYWGRTAAFSYEFWAYPTVTSQLYAFSNGGQSNFDSYAVYMNTGSANNDVGEANSGLGNISGLAVNTAYHVVVTYASATVKTYVNGSLVQTNSVTPPTQTEGNRAYIGCIPLSNGSNGPSTGTRWQGRLAKIAVYNVALTALQVTTHYGSVGF